MKKEVYIFSEELTSRRYAENTLEMARSYKIRDPEPIIDRAAKVIADKKSTITVQYILSIF